MSADSTEITFVRCPSCRSLVPAASTRCRMCGAKLDTAARVDDSEAKDRTRRVRQRTTSEEQEEVSSAVEQIRQEADEVVEESSRAVDTDDAVTEAPAPVESQKADAVEVEDPLSDYLGDTDEEDDLPDEDMDDFLGEEEDDLFDEDEFDDLEEDFLEELEEEEDGLKADAQPSGAESNIVPFAEPVKPSSVIESHIPGPIPVKPIVEEVPRQVETEIEASAPVPEDVTPGTSSDKEVPVVPAGPAKKETSRPKVVVESGPRGRGGLSFGRKKESPEIGAAPAVEPAGTALEKPAAAPVKAEVEERVSAVESLPAEPVMEKPVTDKTEHPRSLKEVISAGVEKEKDMEIPGFADRPVAGVSVQRHEGVRPEGIKSGRLMGWLVNYASAEGTSVELREGRFFATRNSLKQSDLIIDDPSVSTPHALIIVGAGGVMVQDLMSDRGVFHRGRDFDSYRKEIDPFRIAHGDWIRFGDVEFLVSLIAHVGVK